MATDQPLQLSTATSGRSPASSAESRRIDESASSRDEQLLKAADVARRLNVSVPMVYRLMQRGEIPAIHISTAVRVRPSDLLSYIERCRTGSDGN